MTRDVRRRSLITMVLGAAVLVAGAAGSISWRLAMAEPTTPATRPPEPAARPPEPAAKATFLILYRPGPAWAPGKPITEQPPKEHGKYLLALFAKGTMKFAGPFTDNAGGAVVIEVASEADAVAIAKGDPAVVAGVFVYELHPWKLVPWEKYVKK